MRLAEASRQYQIAMESRRWARTLADDIYSLEDELWDVLEDECAAKRQVQKAWVEHCQESSQRL